MKEATIGGRLAAERARLGLSQVDMAARAEIPIDSYKKYEGDRAVPGGEALAGLARAGVNIKEVLIGTGDVSDYAGRYSESVADELKARDLVKAGWNGSDFVALDVYDIRASAGHGAFVEGRPSSSKMVYNRSWLSQSVGIPASRLCLITVAGSSMQPVLHDGDIAMVDRGDIEVLREGIYVFSLDGHLYVKWLELRDDHLVIVSRNADFPPRRLSLLQENVSFKLYGRVVGRPIFQRL